MNEDLEDFEVLLSQDFSVTQFCNDLVRTTNSQPSTSELDLGTPMKKIRYDLNEVESRIEKTIKDNPTHVLDQMLKGKALKSVASGGLKSSLNYLDMSHQRVKEEVLDPYERAQKLQNVLSKVHQTSILLRDGLIYIHLANRIQTVTDNQKELSLDTSLELVTLYSQINLSMNENINLKALKLIKRLETEVMAPTKKRLLDNLSLSLTNHLLKADQIQKNRETISKLARALHTLLPKEFVSTIYKAVLSHVSTSVQILLRTINSIKNFPMAFDEVVKRGSAIDTLDLILQEVKVQKTNLLAEYTTQAIPKIKPRQLYWQRVATLFKKEFEVSFNRGGPVGKSLSRNHGFIVDAIKEKMTSITSSDDDKKDMDIMLKSVSIVQP